MALELKFYEYSDAKNPKYLVIFLHGYGANGENLIELSHQFKKLLPEAHFISPNACCPWDGGFPHSYQWFSLNQDLTLDGKYEEIKNANQILGKFIHAQLDRFKLEPKNLFLIGFSQGAMMAIYQGLIMPKKAAGIIAFSGKLVLPQEIGEKIISKPEICLVHGQADSVVPFVHFEESKKILTREEVPFEAHAIPALDHSIDMAGIIAAQEFIKKCLAHSA